MIKFWTSRNKESEEAKNLHSDCISQENDVSIKSNSQEDKLIEENIESGEIHSYESKSSDNSDDDPVGQIDE